MVKNLPRNAGHLSDGGLIPGSGRSPEGGHDNPLQCSYLGNPMDTGAWRATEQAAESQTRLKRLSTRVQTRPYSKTKKGHPRVLVLDRHFLGILPEPHLDLTLPADPQEKVNNLSCVEG